MLYIAALDYDHLDNGVFLTTLARSLAQQQDKKDVRSIIVHSDSAYTERIIQTGVMRNEAILRSVKDLNNRLVALFADQGVSAIGINPFQRNMITLKDNSLHLDHAFLNSLPQRSVLVLSTLIQDTDKNSTVVLKLPQLVTFLRKELNADELFLFTKSDESEIFTPETTPLNWEILDPDFQKKQIPDEFVNLQNRVRLTTARDFNQIPKLENTILIDFSAS